MKDRPLIEVLREKKKSRIIIDDLVTGSYHLSGMEGLSQGKTVLTYIDSRIDYVLREITGASWYPFINARVEDAGTILRYLINEPDVTKETGKTSRRWIEQYWSEKSIVDSYMQVYNDLLDDERNIKRQESLCVEGSQKKYFAILQPDLIYEARKEQYYKTLSIADKTRIKYKNTKSKIRKTFRDLLPHSIVTYIRDFKNTRRKDT